MVKYKRVYFRYTNTCKYKAQRDKSKDIQRAYEIFSEQGYPNESEAQRDRSISKSIMKNQKGKSCKIHGYMGSSSE